MSGSWKETVLCQKLEKTGKPNASLDWGSSLHCGTSNQEWKWTDLKKCYISNVWDESDDGMLYDGTKDTVNGSSKCKEDIGSDHEMEIPW